MIPATMLSSNSQNPGNDAEPQFAKELLSYALTKASNNAEPQFAKSPLRGFTFAR